MHLTRVHFKLLDAATEESPLWGLTGPFTEIDLDGRRTETHSPMDRQELRPILLELIQQDYVQVFQHVRFSDDLLLSPEDARRVVGDDANWVHSTAPETYWLLATDKGVALFLQARERFAPSDGKG